MKFINNKPLFLSTCLASILFSGVVCLSADAQNKRKPLRISQIDQAQIIESTLRKELPKKEFANVEKFLFVSNEFFSAELIPAIYRNKIEMIEQEEVRAKAKDKAGVLAFSFRDFKVKGSKVFMEFGHSKSYEKGFNAEVTTYEYKKASNKWIGRATKGERTVFE
jgi:hypothetical protein